jgi:hypothetical protein
MVTLAAGHIRLRSGRKCKTASQGGIAQSARFGNMAGLGNFSGKKPDFRQTGALAAL